MTDVGGEVGGTAAATGARKQVSRPLLIAAGLVVMVAVYCAGYLVLRRNGTLTHYWSTGEGHHILRSREYGLSPAFILDVYAGHDEALERLRRNDRYLTLVETVFAPLRLIEARMHADPRLPER